MSVDASWDSKNLSIVTSNGSIEVHDSAFYPSS